MRRRTVRGLGVVNWSLWVPFGWAATRRRAANRRAMGYRTARSGYALSLETNQDHPITGGELRAHQETIAALADEEMLAGD